MKTLKYLFLSVVVLLSTLAAVLVSGPVATSPKSDVLFTGDPDNVVFTWSKSAPAASFDHYEIQVAKDPSFAPAVIVDQDLNYSPGNPDNNTYNIAPGVLDRAKRYYWRVRAVDTLAQPTAWSTAYFRTAVAPPTLVGPADMTVLLNNRPTFEWNSVVNADSYTLQVSLYYDFRSTLINTTIAKTKTEYTPTTDLPVLKDLYWRMRTNSSAYGPSAWTAVRQLTTANPPSIPEPTQPRNGKLTDDYSPRLQWNKSSVPSGTTFQSYEVQIATDSDFEVGDIVLQDALSLTDLNKPCFDINPPVPPTDCGGAGAADLDPAKTYYWRVRAYNTGGEYSSWSSTAYFYTSLEKVTTLNTPADGSTLQFNRPTFDWDDVTGATRYTIVVSPYPNMLSPILTGTASTSQFTPLTNLPPNKTLYWRVRAEALKYGPGMWSDIWSFTTANPPSIPTLQTPANGVLLTTLEPTFRWYPSRLPAGTNFDYYEIEITDDATFATVDVTDQIVGQYSLDYTVAPVDKLDPAKKYYWRLRACNTEVPVQCSDWSPSTRYFRTAVEAPTLGAPANSSSDPYPIHHLFKWNDAFGATSYTLVIGTLPNAGGVVFSATVYPSQFQMVKALKPGTYYWKVRASNMFGFGPSAWSDVWSFTVTP